MICAFNSFGGTKVLALIPVSFWSCRFPLDCGNSCILGSSCCPIKMSGIPGLAHGGGKGKPPLSGTCCHIGVSGIRLL